ncbi:methyltransferase domain-containing protein [Rhodobacterales bacterium HKCCSP123]|nr:methyltransferase domain-containing protein [Rhodobacterales bacterium HKCCSP123]
MQWMDCRQCQHQFTDGYFTDDMLSIVFRSVNENQKVGYNIERQRHVSSRMIEKIIPFKSSGVWLDIGFGNGSLLFTAEEYGFEGIGIDLRPENVEAMKRLGLQAHCDLVQNISFKKKISVVSMMDVLEHMPYPKEVLEFLHPAMEEDAYLLLSMPNSENILWRLMTHQNKNPYYGELEHYHNFGRSRLYSLLGECGYEAVRYGVSERYRVCMEVVAKKR